MAVVPAPRPLLGAVLLLFVSAAWGSAFPLMKDLIRRMPVEDLLAERYLLAGLTLLLIRPGSLRGLPRETWIYGVVLGLMFGVGQTGQAIALYSLPSAVSGFAVGCSVVITPILALLVFKSKVPRRIWAGVVLALAGMTAFTLMRGVEDEAISVIALLVTLAAAALYAGHTLLLAHLSKGGSFHAYPLTVIQLFTIGVLTGGVAVRDGIELPSDGPDWAILAHLSVVSCALGFLARSYGQAHVAAVPSAILMSSQPVWVAAIAVIWFQEQVGWSMIVGGGLMAAAMLLAVPDRSAQAKRRLGRDIHAIAGRAALVLAGLRLKRVDPLTFETGPAPYIAKSACENVKSCPWHTRSLKGGGEPSLERLIQRATVIVRSRNLPGPGCCQSVTLLGRCLCELMQDSGRRRTPLHRWFRSQ
ncbi:DMT family transporter [Nonomuraea jiangxiensis]|uniref:Permease of the drug/metabolite transporter (DMT) superfamily n=1 Tax=Nonomuraea jiangxiensis TaxID=633440 RepID=A0A1G9FS83_9ACTN|nr:DMT family transporter [Nonomuraea jiangxiensis]SDK91258.1 Permease of the drug/metabolite transporter (DMT) superfamily [Nonomuraea jiangxiensis]